MSFLKAMDFIPILEAKWHTNQLEHLSFVPMSINDKKNNAIARQ
jgi:hypothetical protein